jgi:hypothetical protein
VNVAAYDVATGGGVDVWSTPVGTTQWKRQRTGVSTGGGPAPSTQLVFNGDHGWLLQVNRVVTGGAELDGSGDLTPWVPPCVDTMGSARLTASSPTDLVASCHEHEWGGGELASAFYTSHDGGRTFTRVPAPASGDVAAANANTAIVLNDGTMLMTYGAGATWQPVTLP